MNLDMDSVYTDFKNESKDLLEVAEKAVLEFEQGDQEAVNRIFRAAHTIKGNCGLFDLPKTKTLSHHWETMLGEMRNGKIPPSTEIVDLNLECIDRVRRLLDENGEANTVIDDLVEQIDRAMKPEAANTIKPPRVSTLEITPAEKVAKDSTNGNSHHSNGKADKSAKGGLKIPAKFMKVSQERNLYLFVAFLDLAKQNFEYLEDAYKFLTRLTSSNQLLLSGPREDRITSKSLPYFLLFLTEESPEAFLKNLSVKVDSLKVLYNPGVEKSSKENAFLASESSNPSRNDSARNDSANSGMSESFSSESTSNGSYSGVAEMPTNDSASRADKGGEKNPSDTKTDADTHLRVPIRLIDALMNLAGETVVARNELMQKLSGLSDPGLSLTGKKISHLITKLQENIMRSRLQELRVVFQRFPRLVRDVSNATGKKVDLVMSGEDVELDKTLIDALIDPVMHMIRNAIDHGIETEVERLNAGKSPKGTLRINAYLRAGSVALEIKDDGKGLDLEKIKRTAVAKGIITAESAATLTDHEVSDLIFLPGFSTASSVTTTSGRGVGMDVVRSNLKKVGGSVEVYSELGKGTTIISIIPQTLSILTCLLVRTSERMFALPQQNIVELMKVDEESLVKIDNKEVYSLRGKYLPVIRMDKVMDLNAETDAKYLAVVKTERHNFGILLHDIVNPEEIVVKPLGRHFDGLSLFSGSAIMGDGEAVLILDVSGIAKTCNLQANLEEETAKRAELDAQKTDTRSYLLANASHTLFALTVDGIPRIERIESSQIKTMLGAEMVDYKEEVIPLIRLEDVYRLDRKKKDHEYMIIYHVGGKKAALVVGEIQNMMNAATITQEGEFKGHCIIGYFQVNGASVPVVDAHRLLQMLNEVSYSVPLWKRRERLEMRENLINEVRSTKGRVAG